MLKKLLSLLLVLSMLLTLSISLVSCDDKDEDNGKGENNSDKNDDKNDGDEPEVPAKVTYTVTVVDEDGNPVKGVALNFAPKGGTVFPLKTDASGVAGYVTDKELTVTVLAVPAAYDYDKLGQSQSFDADGKLNIVLTKKVETGTKYTIIVVDQNGAPVVGAKVQMCESENEGICLVPVDTNENGEGIYTVEEKGYKAAITFLPEGYEKISDDYTYFDNYVAKIVVNKVAE